MFKDIVEFHTKFKLPGATEPKFLEHPMHMFRCRFMNEELKEFFEASKVGDLEQAADALVDLAYVVLGTAYLMGIPWDECWAEVHRANMTKERAVVREDSKRGSIYDVVKPPEWEPPNLGRILYANTREASEVEPPMQTREGGGE